MDRAIRCRDVGIGCQDITRAASENVAVQRSKQ